MNRISCQPGPHQAADHLHELVLERGQDVIEKVWFGAYQPRQVARIAWLHHAALTDLPDLAQAGGSGHKDRCQTWRQAAPERPR
jgi:hypothetical protein